MLTSDDISSTQCRDIFDVKTAIFSHSANSFSLTETQGEVIQTATFLKLTHIECLHNMSSVVVDGVYVTRHFLSAVSSRGMMGACSLFTTCDISKLVLIVLCLCQKKGP